MLFEGGATVIVITALNVSALFNGVVMSFSLKALARLRKMLSRLRELGCMRGRGVASVVCHLHPPPLLQDDSAKLLLFFYFIIYDRGTVPAMSHKKDVFPSPKTVAYTFI